MNRVNEASDGERERPVGEVEVPWNVLVPDVDIHIVGYGNRLPNDFTLELLAVLKGSLRIFGAPPLLAPQFGIPTMQNVFELCSSDASPDERDREIADIVLAAAADPPVAFATFDTPMVGSNAAHLIVEQAGERGLKVHVTNAVPSFDAIWADLNIEPFFGFAIWDATSFVRWAITPNRHAHLLLPGASAPTDPAADGSTAGSVAGEDALRERLLRFYPPRHEVYVIETEPVTGPHLLATGIETIALRDFEPRADQRRCALLVPRAERAPFDFDRSVPASAVGNQ